MGRNGFDELSRLSTDEIGLVKRGANKKPRFPIFKSEEVGIMDEQMKEIVQAVLETEVDEEVNLNEMIEKAGLTPKAAGAVRGALRLLSSFKDELPKDVMGKLSALSGFGMAEKEDKKTGLPAPEDMDKVKKWFEELPEELRKKFELKTEEEPAPEPEGDDDVDNDEVKKQLEEIQKAHDEQLKALTDQLQAERDIRELSDWTAKAEKDLSHYPGKSSEELAKLLKSLHDTNPELANDQFDSMKVVSEALKKSELFKVSSTVGGITKGVGTGSAWNEIEKLADGLIQKSDDLNLTREAAIVEVLKSERGQELYDRYAEENPVQYVTVPRT